MNDWTYKNKPFTEAPEDYMGFVYEITEKSTGMKYIGKKLFWSTSFRKQKGKKRRIKTVKESNWKSYYGSSKNLQESLEEKGEDDYDRKILRLCRKKGDLSYWEAKEQFDRNVLFDDTYYNNFIGCKIHGKHLTDDN